MTKRENNIIQQEDWKISQLPATEQAYAYRNFCVLQVGKWNIKTFHLCITYEQASMRMAQNHRLKLYVAGKEQIAVHATIPFSFQLVQLLKIKNDYDQGLGE